MLETLNQMDFHALKSNCARQAEAVHGRQILDNGDTVGDRTKWALRLFAMFERIITASMSCPVRPAVCRWPSSPAAQEHRPRHCPLSVFAGKITTLVLDLCCRRVAISTLYCCCKKCFTPAGVSTSSQGFLLSVARATETSQFMPPLSPLRLELLAMGAAVQLAEELETALTSVAHDPEASSRM